MAKSGFRGLGPRLTGSPGLRDLVLVRPSHAMIFRMWGWGLLRFDDIWAMTPADETRVAEDRVENYDKK